MTRENPKRVYITAYRKTSEGVYEIHFDNNITNMSLYELVKKKTKKIDIKRYCRCKYKNNCGKCKGCHTCGYEIKKK